MEKYAILRMHNSFKVNLADRMGNRFSARHIAIMDKLQTRLWRDFPEIQDEAERDNVMEETLFRVTRLEEKQGRPAENLPSAVKLSFRRVVVSLLRKSYHRLRPEPMEARELETLSNGLDEIDVVNRLVMEQFLKTLSEREVQVILLTAEGFTAQDVSKRIGMSVANVYQVVHRIRTRAKGF